MGSTAYITKVLICGGRDVGVSDRRLLLFTREAGMLWATARSVRAERSKQRYALQEFSVSRISLVKGKGGWRIGSAEAYTNLFLSAKDRRLRAALRRVIQLLRRVMPHEEPYPQIFDDVVRALIHSLHEAPENAASVAELCALRTLFHLGYIAPEDSFRTFLETGIFPSPPPKLPHAARRAIERALSASHL